MTHMYGIIYEYCQLKVVYFRFLRSVRKLRSLLESVSQETQDIAGLAKWNLGNSLLWFHRFFFQSDSIHHFGRFCHSVSRKIGSREANNAQLICFVIVYDFFLYSLVFRFLLNSVNIRNPGCGLPSPSSRIELLIEDGHDVHQRCRAIIANAMFLMPCSYHVHKKLNQTASQNTFLNYLSNT